MGRIMRTRPGLQPNSRMHKPTCPTASAAPTLSPPPNGLPAHPPGPGRSRDGTDRRSTPAGRIQIQFRKEPLVNSIAKMHPSHDAVTVAPRPPIKHRTAPANP